MKTVHDKLVIKVNAIDTSEFVLKTHLQIRSRKKWWRWYTSGFVRKTDHNVKFSDKIPGKISSISGLASTVALYTVENIIPNVNGLVQTIDYDASFRYWGQIFCNIWLWQI